MSSLLQAGMLRRWLSSSPQLEIREPNGDGTLKVIQQFPFNQLANRMLWGLWRRMPKYLRPGSPVMAVRTTGVLTPRELADLYRESDVFAFPSVNEGLAQVLLEAMASGLVVVASDLSGAEDCVTEGETGSSKQRAEVGSRHSASLGRLRPCGISTRVAYGPTPHASTAVNECYGDVSTVSA